VAKVIDSTAAPAGFVRRHIAWWITLVVLGLGVWAFLWWRAKNDKPRYVTATVTRGNVQRAVSMTGALNPLVTVQVGSYVSGTIKSLGCDFNTEVVVGKVCATIDPVPFQLIVDQDRAEVGTAEAQLKKDQAALVYAKIAFERDSKLLKEGTVSQDTVDNDKSVYDQAAAQVGLDQASIVDKIAALKAAQVNLAYTNIVSPVVGTVITRSIDVGQTVAASLSSPTLFLIGKDLTKMQVDTNVSEADVGDVRIGQAGVFTVQAFPGRTFHGVVTQIRRGPITVQNVVTYDVVVAFDNPGRLLFPGMTADTHIVIDEHDNVLRVPLPAIRFTPEGIGHGRRGGRPGGAAGAETAGEATSSPGAPGAPAPPESTGEAAAGGPSMAVAPGSPQPEAGAGRTHGPREGGQPEGTGGRRRRQEGDGEGRHRPEAGAGDAAGGGEGRHRHEGDGAGRYRSDGGQPEGAAGEGSPDGRRRWRREGQGEGGPAGRQSGPGEARPAAPGQAGQAGQGRGPGGRFPGRPAGGERRGRVWVLQPDGTLRAVAVTLGLDDGALIEVSGAGLHAGDKVVVNEASQEERRRNAQGPSTGQGQNQILRQGGPRL
jgi:HlyD family secretion protein